MMRSLWSGVTGLQAHQIAMDVEGNNIANVNTVGFKYSRANFADMLSQTPRIATAPQGELGGQNPLQIGLGTSINSTTRIFSQGTLQSTDKNTDLALQGDGFFVVSPDGGKTKLYTRNGDFVRDRAGNFVNNSGYIAQGWTRDEETGTIDSTAPVKNIVIKEGLTTPARATSVINVKGNLDSGNSIGNRSTPIYTLDSFTGGKDFDGDGEIAKLEEHLENDTNSNQFRTNSKSEQILTERGVSLGVLFDEAGNGVALREGQGVWISYANAKSNAYTFGSSTPATIGQYAQPATLDITLNGTQIKSAANGIRNISDIASLINAQYTKTGVKAEVSAGNKLTLINRNDSSTTENTKNIHLVVNPADTTRANPPAQPANPLPAGTMPNTLDIVTAYQYKYSATPTAAVHDRNDKIPRIVNTTEDLREAMQRDAREFVHYTGDGNLNVNMPIYNALQAGNRAYKRSLAGATNPTDPNALNAAAQAGIDAVRAALQGLQGANGNNQALTDYDNAVNGNPPVAAGAGNGTLEQFNRGVAHLEANVGDDLNDGVKFTVNAQGQFQLENPKDDKFDKQIYLNVTGLTTEATINQPATNENVRFTNMLSSLEGSLSPGQAIRTSAKFMMSSHGSTVEIHDSLGSKHTVNIKWAKVGTTNDGGTEWNMVIQVPEPSEINFSGEGPANVITGALRFNPDGSLASFHPASFTFTGNNGSLGGQSVSLNFGLGTDFNGLTSFDKDSNTEYINQDGYEGGTLKDIKVDETGTIIGAFTNGQSFGLAQVSVATFTNNEGLQAEGGNVFSATANSGEAVIGMAGRGNKGTIAAAKLEQSNVDLSRALTQLIVVQRGFQANSKTITTSDEMLNTLLQLKN